MVCYRMVRDLDLCGGLPSRSELRFSEGGKPEFDELTVENSTRTAHHQRHVTGHKRTVRKIQRLSIIHSPVSGLWTQTSTAPRRGHGA